MKAVHPCRVSRPAPLFRKEAANADGLMGWRDSLSHSNLQAQGRNDYDYSVTKEGMTMIIP
ncbi:hypothetical protein JCM15831A_09980 [Asaia astilbis]